LLKPFDSVVVLEAFQSWRRQEDFAR